MASAALGQSERVAEIRSYFAQGLTASAQIFAERFEKRFELSVSRGRFRPTYGRARSST